LNQRFKKKVKEGLDMWPNGSTHSKRFQNKKYLAALLPLLAALLACNLLQSTNSTSGPQVTTAPAQSESTETAPAQEAATTTQAPGDLTAAPTLQVTSGSAVASGGGNPSGDPRQAVINSMNAMLKAGPYRIHMVSTTADGTSTTMDGEVILPDSFHLTTTTGEFIILGSKAYIKQDGKWSLFPMDMGSMVSGLRSSFTEEAMNNIKDVSYVGADTAGGTPAQVYQYTESMTVSNQTITSQVKEWIGIANGLPVKIQVESEYAGIKSTSVQEIQYDSSITIEAPNIQ
jgi:hypothetical protein